MDGEVRMLRRWIAKAREQLHGMGNTAVAKKSEKGSEAWGVCPIYAEGDCKFGTNCYRDCLRVTPQHPFYDYADVLRQNMARSPEDFFVEHETNQGRYAEIIRQKFIGNNTNPLDKARAMRQAEDYAKNFVREEDAESKKLDSYRRTSNDNAWKSWAEAGKEVTNIVVLTSDNPLEMRIMQMVEEDPDYEIARVTNALEARRIWENEGERF